MKKMMTHYSQKIALVSLLCFVLISAKTATSAPEDTRKLKILSLSIRDEGPSIEEAKAVANNERTVQSYVDEWLESSKHIDRVRRYFADLFMVPNDFFVNEDPFFLDQTSDGVWYSAAKGSCTLGQAVNVAAWWTSAEGQTVKVCPSISSTSIFIQPSGNYFGCMWSSGFLQNGCGCGPSQLYCYPKSFKNSLVKDLGNEPRDRATAAYQSNLSWSDTVGSSKVFASRPMMVYYLMTQYVAPWQAAPSPQEITKLFSIPLNTKSWVNAPGQGAERAGIATTPAFLKRYNNFRSRIRAITDSLLCKDIDPSLNTSGISTLVNPHHTALDQSIASRPQCASCHYAMDNLGATLFGWDDNAGYTRWPVYSQQGHAFGQNGTGPKFLMESYVDRAPGFIDCMAKKAWESFAGRSWDALSPAEKHTLSQAAAGGPRDLIRTVLTSTSFVEGGSSGSSGSGSSTLNFYADIEPILKASCANGGCHGPGSSLGQNYQFVGNEAKFKQAPLGRIQDGSMPPSSSGLQVTPAQRAILIKFLQQ